MHEIPESVIAYFEPINKEEQERKELDDINVESFVIVLEKPDKTWTAPPPQLYTAPCPRWFALLYKDYWKESELPHIQHEGAAMRLWDFDRVTDHSQPLPEDLYRKVFSRPHEKG